MTASTSPGMVSVWVTTVPLHGIHDDFLEGGDAVLCWLLVDFGVAVDGAFSTSFTPNRELERLVDLLEPLHGSEVFAQPLIADLTASGIGEASFAIALYDIEVDLAALGHDGPPGSLGTPYLTYAGAYPYV
ncbi:MAG: hypothetical protein R3B72_43645 [Polyangiaceae bacterium]